MNFKINALIITLSFFLYPFLTHSQKICYLDRNGHPISVQECNNQIEKEKLGWGYVKTDTGIVYQLSVATKQGKLPLNFVKKIRSALEKYSSKNIDSNAYLVIQYYTGIEDLLLPDINNKRKIDHYSKNWPARLRKIGKVNYYNIYNPILTPANAYAGLRNNFRDELNIFDQFFELQYPLFSDICIRPDGNNCIFYGVSVNPGMLNHDEGLRQLLSKDFDAAKL